MPLDLKELLKNNPQINIEELNKGLKMAEDLRSTGMRTRPNRSIRPLIRHRVRIMDDLESDPRVTRVLALNR